MGSSPRKGCRSALFGDREGCRSDGAEGCRSKGSSRRKGVDLRSGDREGCRSAAWSELELFDPRLRRVRKCSIRRFARTGRVSIRAPGAREGCRSMARIRPEGCRSARPAPARGVDPWHGSGRKGVDPRVRRLRRVSIRGIEQTGSVRSEPPETGQVFDPRGRGAGCKCSIRTSGKCSIRRIERTGRVSIRAPGAREGCRSMAWIGPEGCRSARPATPKGLDPRPRRPRKCSIRASGKCSIRVSDACASVRSARPASVRSAGSCGPEGCRSARPAPAKGVDPWHGSGRKGVDPCVRRLQRVSIPGIERLRRCSIRGFGACAGVRSVAWSRTDLFDPRPRRPRSVRSAGVGQGASVRFALRPAA